MPRRPQALVDRLSLNYPVAMGNVRLGSRYGGVLGLPLTFLIDRNGVIRARFQGETDLRVIRAKAQGPFILSRLSPAPSFLRSLVPCLN